MTALLGRTLILVALFAAVAGALVAFGGKPAHKTVRLARRLSDTFAYAMIAANLLMIAALLGRDFSVGYVAQVGAINQPDWVAFVSLWSSLEGSILFWGLVLAIYILVATRYARALPAEIELRSIGVWLGCAGFFSFLIAAPAQPFGTVSPVPPDGPGPNPLLQNHILMAVHPPMLYLGYVGMTIPFGFAAAALMTRESGAQIIAFIRRSLLAAWCFLTVAIMLGGWWAYEVLGWGGYWAWDPVENASFLPWLTATAALHSIIIFERRGRLRAWSMTLVLVSFLLTILGTFMTRSGVFNSVHSFTQSEIGPTILGFLAVAILFSVGLLAIEPRTTDEQGGQGAREVGFLTNNLLLAVLTLTILIGTVFPLLVEAIRGTQMSVGRPYFDRMAVPIGFALLFLMGIGPVLPWGRIESRSSILRRLLAPLAAGIVAALLAAVFGIRNFWTVVVIGGAAFTMWVTLAEISVPVRQRARSLHESWGAAFRRGLIERGRRRTGAYLAHAGTVLVFVAIAISSTQSTRSEAMLDQESTMQIGHYTLELLRVDVVREPHRLASIARVRVYEEGRLLGVMSPRMNQYETQRDPVGTPDVYTRLTHDLYLSTMSIDPGAQRVGLLAIINPAVAWIWGATFLIALGGLFAALPRAVIRSRAHDSSAVEPSLAGELSA
ncbi:MAG: cytochrome c biogenesis protein CcsA [Acidobacteria bacterium]|nr:cytochrome c biogenesis protein CcsA [Acidobacteriota bacterium]